ncbi:histidine protein methyltransferase 1 [Clarias magur]|uniref:protein-histidine N-methyltransferase n=1 Tax=Clarias magur TaxID=1594786 RepID=A0A8J4XHL7_CLAMG|nr:histidine protein methyltransferase 1 [Clarias magur]
MAFSFNFNISSEIKQNCTNEEDDNKDTANNQVDETSARKKVKEALEHRAAADLLSSIDHAVTETLTIGALPPLLYLNESVFEQTASERDDAEKVLSQTITQNSDLITGVYEGGLKIWEGTQDLLEYIDNEGKTFSGKRVLDLGCGAGLLGILALKRGASKVHFQDYNSTVIEQLTIPNVFLNSVEEGDDKNRGDEDCSPAPKRRSTEKTHALGDCCGFFSGDWVSFLSLIQSQDPTLRYDLIFTSETIYNTDYYPSLHDVFQKLLAEHGVVYLATKSHYFGVGGGLYLFESFVEGKNVFQIKSLRELDQGLKRHIVSLSFKKSPS